MNEINGAESKANDELVENWINMYRFLNNNKMYILNNQSFNTSTSINCGIFKKINSLICAIEDKLRIHCCHEIEVDYIDITPDYMIQIHYCSMCLLSF